MLYGAFFYVKDGRRPVTKFTRFEVAPGERPANAFYHHLIAVDFGEINQVVVEKIIPENTEVPSEANDLRYALLAYQQRAVSGLSVIVAPR